jgi:tetratricopeptide (TPR) repeat protein
MFHTLKSHGGKIAAIIFMILAPLTLVVSDCGKNDRSDDSPIQITKDTGSSADVSPPALPDTEEMTASMTPEEPVVQEPMPPREVTYEEAETAYNERRYDDAKVLFTLYSERKSDNPWGLYMLGLSSWKAGDLASSEAAFEEAIALDSNHVKSYLNLSRVLLEMGETTDALDKLDKAVEIDPASSVAYRLQGRAYHNQGLLDRAVDAYRHAISIDNQDAWSMNNLALIYIEQERFAEALPPLALAVELKDDVSVFFNNLGIALERTGHFRAAEDAYASASGIDASNEKATDNLNRISEVVENPGVEQVDLALLAQRFNEEIDIWISAADSTKPAEVVEADTPTITEGIDPELVSHTDAIVSSEVDSTGNRQEQ